MDLSRKMVTSAKPSSSFKRLQRFMRSFSVPQAQANPSSHPSPQVDLDKTILQRDLEKAFLQKGPLHQQRLRV